MKAIKTDKDYQAALAMLDKLFDGETKSDIEKAEVLVILIQDYERNHYPIEAPTPVEAIKFRMEQQNLRQADLVKYLGSESRVSEILNGRRSLTLNMIVSLNKGLDIPLESLIENKKRERRKLRYKAGSGKIQMFEESKASYKKKKS